MGSEKQLQKGNLGFWFLLLVVYCTGFCIKMYLLKGETGVFEFRFPQTSKSTHLILKKICCLTPRQSKLMQNIYSKLVILCSSFPLNRLVITTSFKSVNNVIKIILIFEIYKNLYFTIHPEYQGCKNNTTFPISKIFYSCTRKEKKKKGKKPHMLG